MGKTVTLSGTVSLGDACGLSGCGESSDLTVGLGFGSCCTRQAARSGGSQERVLNSPNAFVALPALGPSGDVTQGDFLMIRANAPVEVRLTTDDGLGGQTVIDPFVTDLVLMTFGTSRLLELIEVKGSAVLAYLVSGPS